MLELTMFMYTHSSRVALIRAIAVIAALHSQVAFAGDQGQLREQFEVVQKTLAANCAECYGASKESFQKAVVSLEELIAAGFSNPKARKVLAQSYQTWAFAYSQADAGQSRELQNKARAVYRELIEQYPNDPDFWCLYGQSLEDPAEAIKALERAETLSPADPSIQYSLGMFYAHGLGQFEKGVTYIAKAVKLEENHPKLRYMEQLARIYEQSGNASQASNLRREIKAFEVALEERQKK